MVTRETILVTGSSGLIGTAVCAVLAARGHDARRFDIADHAGGHGDIRVPGDLAAALRGCAGVIHLAAVSRVIWGEQDPGTCRETNITGTQNIVAQLQRAGPQPWLILGSSREVYGQSPVLPVTEAAPLRPMNHYARSKVAAEEVVRTAMAAGLRAAILRFSTVYGASTDHADRVIPAFCRAAIRGAPLRVEGAGNSLDITHLSDVAASIADVAGLLALGHALPPIHLTTGRATRLGNLARLVVRLAGSDSPIVPAAPRAFDVANFTGDPASARARIGWRPGVALDSGLRALIAQIRRQG